MDELIKALLDVISQKQAQIGISEASVKIDRGHHKVAQTLLTGTFQIIEAALSLAGGGEG